MSTWWPRFDPVRVVVVAALLAATLGAATTAAAAAITWTPVPETGTPGQLSLMSDDYPKRLPDLSPGRPASWQVHTQVERHQRVRLDLRLRKAGTLVSAPDGLRVSVRACQDPWDTTSVTPTCDRGGWAIASATPADDFTRDSPVFLIAAADSDGTVYLLVTLAVADTATAAADESLMGLTATIGLGLTASETSWSTSSSHLGPDQSQSAISALAVTGGGILDPVLLAVALVLGGVAVRWRRVVRRSPGPEETC